MRKFHFNILAFATILFSQLTLTGCSDNEDTTPSYADSDRLESLIDNDIEKIVQFKDSYGTYILYNFRQDIDFAYQFEQATNWNAATLNKINHDDAVVGVDWLYSNFFNCYNDEYKNKLFPRKLLLVSDIISGQELGLSTPVNNRHSAVANINSVTFAGMSASNISSILSDKEKARKLKENMHRALLADYLVKARGVMPVDDPFYNYSATYYSSLMDSKRRNARMLLQEDPNFFIDRGFFFPSDDEATYFPSAEDDIIAYITTMITMDEARAEELMNQSTMANKMHMLVLGMQSIGIDIKKVNPNAEQFLNLEPIIPTAIIATDVVTDNSKATMDITILRGSHPLDYLNIKLNGTDLKQIDLKQYDKNRIVIPLELTGLAKGENIISLSVFELGEQEPAQIIEAKAIYASIDNIVSFLGKCEEGDKTTSITIKFSEGDGGVVDKSEKNPNLTTISFENYDWTPETENDPNCSSRAWKVYRENDKAARIEEYEFVQIDIYTEPTWELRHTYTFSYNGSMQLQNVTYTPVEGNPSTLIDNVRYTNNLIQSYDFNGNGYTAKYATASGITTRVDCLDANMSGLCYSFNGTEPLNSKFHRPEIPAVIPGCVADVPLQLLYSEYLFNSLGNVWTSNWEYVREGNAMAVRTHATVNGRNWTYTFKLKTE